MVDNEVIFAEVFDNVVFVFKVVGDVFEFVAGDFCPVIDFVGGIEVVGHAVDVGDDADVDEAEDDGCSCGEFFGGSVRG